MASATVEIQTLTISGKQVTLAVFRQLIEEPPLNDQLEWNGTPWGTVNYHWKDCACSRGIKSVHLVWQRGSELRRGSIPADWTVSPPWQLMRAESDTLAALRRTSPWNPELDAARAAHTAADAAITNWNEWERPVLERSAAIRHREVNALPHLFIAV